MSEATGPPVEVTAWDEAYRAYQAKLTREVLLPTLRRWGVNVDGRRVLEVGCGVGGCIAELARAGASAAALDIDARLVATAQALDRREGVSVRLAVGDATAPQCALRDEGAWDLVLLRDVVEHIEPLKDVLETLRDALAPDGAIFAVFPPYWSPFGAHQQILPRRTILGVAWNKAPWIHLLPDALFMRVASGDSPAAREVRRLRGIRLTLRRFERLAREARLDVAAVRHYLLRPSFGLRYGAPVLEAGWLGKVPGIREIAVTAGYYLLRRKGD